jgi:hypothetical protein
MAKLVNKGWTYAEAVVGGPPGGAPLLGRLKLIVEPWDVGRGGYRVGAFPAP